MWIILLFLYTSVIISTNAQDKANFVTQADTATSYISNVANVDSTRPPVTVTIRNRQTVNSDQSTTKNSDEPLIYSNEWQPVLLPFGLNHGESNSNLNLNTHTPKYQLSPTFLRRPDSEANNTVPLPYIQTVARDEFTDEQIPYSPVIYFQRTSNKTSESLISDTDQVYSESLANDGRTTNEGFSQFFDLYRNSHHFIPPVLPIDSTSQLSLSSNEKTLENKSEPKEASSDALQKSTISNSERFGTNEQNFKPLTIEQHRTEQEIFNPMSFYQSNYRYLPQAVQGYYNPYPFVPIQTEGTFQRVVPNPPNDPNLDRESGLEIHDKISQSPERQVLQEGVSGPLAENIPSETVADTIPPQPVPLPVGGYPFRFYPSSFIPPLLPNIPAPRFTLKPLRNPHLTHASRENIHFDASRPLPIVPVGPLPELTPNVLPKTVNLEPGEQIKIQTDVQVIPGASIPDEELNATKIPYEFGFHMNDGKGNDQHRKEISDISGVVTGSYGYSDEDGVYRFVEYIADKNGFRAFIKSNEPGVASSGSANVVVMAERPPPKTIAEGRKETAAETIAVSGTNVDEKISGSNLESE